MRRTSEPRRRLLRGLLSALALAPAGALLSIAPSQAKARKRGDARIDVRHHGARGDGRQDDTRAFQAAIDALPAEGGTVVVPTGTYLIDPVRSVRLSNRMHLSMAPDAKLMAKPNAAERAYVLTVHQVDDVEISGGRIVGERDAHLGQDGEWGHGIMVRGASRVTVRDIHISRCWGDGISIGGAGKNPVVPSRDVLIAHVVCDGNRRQGLTIGRSRQVHVRDSEFTNTGGVLPGCGIDVEPDAGDSASGVMIENCRVAGNRGAGIQLYRRSANATIRNCTIEDNRGAGIFVLAAQDCVIAGNWIRRNGLTGVSLRPGTRNVQVDGNRFVGNGRQSRMRAKDASAPSAATKRKQLAIAEGAQEIRVGEDNQFD